MLKTFKILFIAVVVIVLAAAAYAFAAANTVPATKAGSGAGAITGYTVSAITYTLNAADPTTLDAVNFTLSAAATQVKVRLVDAGSWYTCTLVSGNDWTCATTGLLVSTMDNLTVVAASN